MTSGALSEAWGFVKGPKRVPDAADPGRRPGSDRLASPAARPRAPHGRLRPRGHPDQPGEHRQGLRDRPGGRGDSRPTGGRRRPWCTAAGRASTRSARRRASSAAAGRSRCAIRSSRNRPWACFGCGIAGWGPRARRSSSSSPTAGSTATSSTRGRASRPSGRPA